MTRPTNIILILLSIGLFYTFTSPQYEQVKALQTSAREYQSVIANVAKIAETRDNLLVNYENIPRADLEHLAKVLPDNVDIVGLAVDLDTIASRYGISLQNVKVETEATKDARLITLPEYDKPYDKVTVSFSFISNYPNFMRFLTDLEKSLRIMDVRSASFKTSDTLGLYQHQLKVETYWLK